MLARFPRFPTHPPVGLTQRMSQHNIKAPLKKRPMVAPTGMVGTQNYNVGASIARPSPLPPPCLQAIALCATDEVKKLKPDGCGGNQIRAAQPHTSIIHYSLFTIPSQAQPAPLSPQTLQPKCNQKISQKRLKPAVAYAIIKKNMFGEDFGPNSSVFDKTFSTQYLKRR